MKPFTAIIAWDDDDVESGEFRVTVLAETAEEAEKAARELMWEDDQANGVDPDQRPEYGRVIELQEGAMYEAFDLQTRLRAVLASLALDPADARRKTAIAEAEELLTRLDAGDFGTREPDTSQQIPGLAR